MILDITNSLLMAQSIPFAGCAILLTSIIEHLANSALNSVPVASLFEKLCFLSGYLNAKGGFYEENAKRLIAEVLLYRNNRYG